MVTFSAEAIVIITALLGALASVVVFLFRALMSAKDAQNAFLIVERNSYRDMAESAIRTLESHVNKNRGDKGKAPFAVVPPVEAEHNSPTTPKQQGVADVETMRKRLVAAMEELSEKI